jgi:hypothetical protein
MSNIKQPKKKTDTNNAVRNKINDVIENKAVMNNSIDLITLKRTYPKRFLSDILEQEGYRQTSYNKFEKI